MNHIRFGDVEPGAAGILHLGLNVEEVAVDTEPAPCHLEVSLEADQRVRVVEEVDEARVELRIHAL